MPPGGRLDDSQQFKSDSCSFAVAVNDSVYTLRNVNCPVSLRLTRKRLGWLRSSSARLIVIELICGIQL